MPPEPSAVLIDGPWTHREVTANGARFHLAESGPADGPLILMLHGFPQFWWSWRYQLASLAAAGFRVAAPDLRGYGGSDKPPRGYDGYTLSSDVAGMIRALGARDAHVVGHDWGGVLAWAVAALHPGTVRTLTTIAMPHPLRLRAALLRNPAQARAAAHIGFFQLPKVPEARLTRNDAAYVEALLRRWGGPGFPDPETALRYRTAMQIPGVAHSSLEWYRWAVRSLTRPSGQRFQRLLGRGVTAPVLQVHGRDDHCLLATSVQGSQAYAHGRYLLELLEGVGHFPHEEAASAVNTMLIRHADA